MRHSIARAFAPSRSQSRSGGKWRRGAAIAAALVGSACIHTPTPAPPVEYLDYRIGPPDRLTVTVLPDPAIVENTLVRPDGMITIQLIGDVRAGGRTTQEIASDIESRIARFKRGALVTVALANAESAQITVLGEVRGPTTFPLTRQIRVSEAIGTVGGPTLFANDDDVRVVRPGNPPEVIEVDLQAIRSGDLSTNVQLYGGDIVYVPPTALVKVGYVIQQILFPFTPIFSAGGVATRAIR